MIASTFTVTGTRGFLVLLAFLLFAVAAILSIFAAGHKAVMACIAGGLALWAFSELWTG